ncbi:hypothetical protein GGR95_000780 [Sulfitobacter undariae]|uniref:Uncharacterized protein n=1 Tax=Sulfitobacter undariae TaxID=1563671 RepID=A0A7W6GZM3_9RHOB|nr:hypothetical protein [Sulfitobacter undariae]MBB3993152.1 hypothetical protein [Sulfitobacter undariae]
METALIIIGFIVLCIIGIAWDYYKPARFRSSYRNVKTRGEIGGGTGGSGGSDWSGDNWGGDCGGGDGGGD